MRQVLLVLGLALAGCASIDGRGLVPGQSTQQDVEAKMGRPVETRRQANGETWLYYSSQPYGRANYVARIAPGGTMVAFENRLTDANVAKIQIGKWTREEVRELLGPPAQVTSFPRMDREAWTYYLRPFGTSGTPMVLYAQFSADGIAREVYEFDESSLYITPHGSGRF